MGSENSVEKAEAWRKDCCKIFDTTLQLFSEKKTDIGFLTAAMKNLNDADWMVWNAKQINRKNFVRDRHDRTIKNDPDWVGFF